MIFEKYSIIFLLSLVVNFNIIYGQNPVSLTTSEACPPNYELRNGLCNSILNSNLSSCPAEYFLHTDGLCYPKERKPCPGDAANKSEEMFTTTPDTPTLLTTTTIIPYAVEIKRPTCPDGTIMYKNKCRKVICTLGEYYRGACHRPICPPGLVWRGKQCQKPGFVTTVIEIENNFINQINEKSFALEINEHNKIINHTTTVMPLVTTNQPAFLKIKETSLHPTTATNETCCLVITPRICKKYIKWQCFNRKYNICDNRICTAAPLLYLKAPEIKYEPPVLVMPPNPQLDACKSKNCNNDSDIVDCSGCAEGSTEKCSPYCYSYICPNKTCTFMNLKDYCSFYPAQNGCLERDGCLWNWCSKSATFM